MTTAISNAYQSLKTSSFCTEVSKVGAKGVTWLSQSANTLRVNGGAAVSKVAAFVSSLFSGAIAKTGTALRAVRDAAVTVFGKGKDAFSALPKEAKLGAAIAMVGAAILTAFYLRAGNDADAASDLGGNQHVRDLNAGSDDEDGQSLRMERPAPIGESLSSSMTLSDAPKA